eukprot:Hpha_TRINITY_DN23306_c0_g1::TRINITY_DN23306_c0_g1_i1::g.96841::m.96841
MRVLVVCVLPAVVMGSVTKVAATATLTFSLSDTHTRTLSVPTTTASTTSTHTQPSATLTATSSRSLTTPTRPSEVSQIEGDLAPGHEIYLLCAAPAYWNGTHCTADICVTPTFPYDEKAGLKGGEWVLVMISLIGVLLFVCTLACVTDSLLEAEPSLPELPEADATGEWNPGAGAVQVVEEEKLVSLLEHYAGNLLILAGGTDASSVSDREALVARLRPIAGVRCAVVKECGGFTQVFVHAAGVTDGKLWLPSEALEAVSQEEIRELTTRSPPSPPAARRRTVL